jgi:hypothetical protein
VGFATGPSEDPVLMNVSAYLKAHLKRPVCATRDRRVKLAARPRGGRNELSYPETKQMGRSTHSYQDTGPARQSGRPDHCDSEQDVTNHEQDCGQSIDDHHG